MNDKVYRGEMYYVYPTDYCGSEQGGGRPGIIISNDMNNEHSRTVEVVFLTTREKTPLPTHVHISTAKRPSTALCEQVHTVDKRRLGSYAGEINSNELEKVEKAVAVGLALNLNMNTNKAILAWGKLLEKDPGLSEWECDEEVDELEPTIPIGDIAPVMAEHEKPTDGGADGSIEHHPAYVRLMAERDVYKELYLNLVQAMRTA